MKRTWSATTATYVVVVVVVVVSRWISACYYIYFSFFLIFFFISPVRRKFLTGVSDAPTNQGDRKDSWKNRESGCFVSLHRLSCPAMKRDSGDWPRRFLDNMMWVWLVIAAEELPECVQSVTKLNVCQRNNMKDRWKKFYVRGNLPV